MNNTEKQPGIPHVGSCKTIHKDPGKWLLRLFSLMLLLGIFSIPVEGWAQCPTPTNVTRNPATICVGGTSTLSASTTSPYNIAWYTAPSGGSPFSTSSSVNVSPSSTTTYYAGTQSPSVPSGSRTYNYTGGFQTFTVPSGVTSISIDVRGGQGRSNQRGVAGGFGGRIVGGYSVTPGQVLRVYVGGGGGISTGGAFPGGGNAGSAGCFNSSGGGGGGRSDVRVSPYSFNASSVIAVAGGGGGAGGNRNQGCGPGSGGGGGGGWFGGGGGGGYNATAGTGGTQTGGGAGGIGQFGGGNGGAGAFGNGGGGGTAPASNQAGTNTGPTGGAGGANTGATGGSGSPNWRGGGGGGGSNLAGAGFSTTGNFRGWEAGNGQVIITWSSTSGCNSTTRVPVTVTVVPDPTISISTNRTQVCAGGSATLSASVSNGVGCSTQWQFRNGTSGTWSNFGTNVNNIGTGALTQTRQYRAIRNCTGSGCGQAISNTQTVTVDNVAPNALCRNVTINLNASGNGSVTAGQVNNGSTDNCTISNLAVSPSSFNCSDVGNNAVTLTVTDNNGNVSTCNATVTVEDNVPPVAVCQDITIQLDSQGQASIQPADVDGGSTDACGISSLAINDNSFICADTNGNTIQLTVTDVNNNTSTCLATVTVEDNIAPVARCRDATVSLNNLGQATLLPLNVDDGTTDNCGLQSLFVVPGVYSCSNVGTVTATLRATDVSGNLSTCTAQITVQDLINPIAICQDVTVQLDNNGQGSTTPFQVNNGSNDACGLASYVLDNSNFDCSDVGPNPVVLTVTDNNGNSSSCNATVTVEDNVAPNAICQNLTIQLDSTGNASITPQQVDNGSNDACGIDTIYLDRYTFDCTDQGPNTVNLTVIDNNGNVSGCSATVTVTVDPIVIVLTSPTYNCGFNISCNGNNDGEATAAVTGGCLPYTYLWDDPANQTTATAVNLSAGTYMVTVTDVNGNSAQQTITLTEPDELLVDLGPDITANFGCSCVDLAPVSITGGCPPYTYLWGTQESTQSINVCPDQTTVYPITVTDANGCEAKDTVIVSKPSNPGQTDKYVVLGGSEVEIGDRSVAIEGAVGVNGAAGDLRVGNQTNLNVPGNSWILGQNVTVGSSSTVGDIYTATTPAIGGGSSVGNINGLPNPMPVTPCTPNIPGGANISVGSNQTVNLTPEDYGVVTISNRGVLSLAPGIYTFTQINGSVNASVVSSTGIGSDVAIFVGGTVEFASGADVIANISSPTSRIRIGDNSTVYGSVIADQVVIGTGVTLKLESFCWGSVGCGTNKEEVAAEIESSLGEAIEMTAYPNPFKESTNIQFRLSEADQVTIEILSVNGMKIATIFNEAVEAGITYEAAFAPEDKSAGIYFYRLTTQRGIVRNGKLVYQR